ncbi:unnamed protein product [Cylindrotheca closterium]|uniref:Uncharacterized protein n=1 Tax=Cylindrotheca closterium TaxID=2856 RepID=A0AAD2CX37_9STRA|nr:unnamed protein product [Cylindrotheca closterium]
MIQQPDDELDEEFFFLLKGNRGSSDQHVEEMLELVTVANIQNLKVVLKLSQVLNRQLLPAVIQVFESLEVVSNDSSSLPKWKILRVQHMEGWRSGEFDISQLRQALDIANRASLFEIIDLDISSHNDSEPPRTTGISHLLPSIERNQRLRSLTMGGNQSLSTGDLKSLNRLLNQPSCNLDCLKLYCRNLEHPLLCEGLTSNTSLSTLDLCLDSFSCREDESVASLFKSLEHHPKLETLKVRCELTLDLSDAIRSLLSSTTVLKNFELNSFHGKPTLNIDDILEGLANNKSLETLIIRNPLSSPRPLTNLLRTWKSHPKLSEVSLSQKITEEDIVEAQAEGAVAQRVVGRMVTASFVVVDGLQKERQETLLRGFLFKHPEVRYYQACHSSDVAISVQHASWWNASGRYLMHRSDVPLGLWPLVLEKVEQAHPLSGDYDRFRHQIVYDFLYGEALVNRS